ncbi:CoA transferase [Lachnospiraceae bacterium ZAX-1]
MGKKPFEGLKVIDMTGNLAGPMCCSMLADFGADVIKIERPKVGGDERGFGPFVDKTSLLANALNRGKRSLAMPLKDEDSLAIIKKLLPDTDILVQSYRPGFMASIGLDYESVSKINPRLIYGSISLYGHESKFAKEGGYDMLAQARTGMISMNGRKDGPPVVTGFTVCDEAAGLNTFGGLLVALYHRERTGEGQHVDIGLFNAGFAMNDYAEMATEGFDVTRNGDHHISLVPFGVFHNKGGSLLIMALSPKLWAGLCEVMGREDLAKNPDYETNAKRLGRRQEVDDIVSKWFTSFDDTDTPRKILEEKGIPCAKILSNVEAVAHAEEAGVNMLVEVPAPKSMKRETIKIRTNAMKLSKTPGYPTSAAPVVGEHSVEILKSMGYDDNKIEEMLARWNA